MLHRDYWVHFMMCVFIFDGIRFTKCLHFILHYHVSVGLCVFIGCHIWSFIEFGVFVFMGCVYPLRRTLKVSLSIMIFTSLIRAVAPIVEFVSVFECSEFIITANIDNRPTANFAANSQPHYCSVFFWIHSFSCICCLITVSLCSLAHLSTRERFEDSYSHPQVGQLL